MPYQIDVKRAHALGAMFFLLASLFGVEVNAQERPWFDREAEWKGYRQYHFTVAERPAYLVVPKQAAPGKPWIWRARFPGYHADMDTTLLGHGYHVAYVDVAAMFGNPESVKIGDELYQYLITKHGLSPKPVLEGVSRGGLFVYNWMAKNPDKVACIYCDTPVCDISSWPGGKGTGLGSAPTWQQCLRAYGLTDEESETFAKNPIDHAEIIAKNEIPILHIVSENDRVVPPKENTYLLQSRLEQHGHQLEVISVPEGTAKSNGHHFEHPQPQRVVKFITRHTTAAPSSQELLRQARRLVFLGDSITYAGHYVEFFDAWLLTQQLENPPVVINVGLPSETVSGLSEKGHAGGRFPRPDLAERLERVLAVTKPDLVFACYGINCGIYEPFDDQRFDHYQQGIHNLRKHVEAVGAKLVLITPPFYDDQRARKKSFSYDSVLDHYAKWLMSMREKGWLVVDLHEGMAREVAKRRELAPEFTFQPDAVHPNVDGHWFIAKQLFGWFGDESAANADSPQKMLAARDIPEGVLQTVRQRLNIRRDAYLSAARHKRPGIRGGLPVKEAEQQAGQLTAKIQEIRKATP